MTDSNSRPLDKLAILLSRVFHPVTVAIPTSILLLNEMPIGVALGLTLVVIVTLVTPVSLYLNRYGFSLKERSSRQPFYFVTFAGIVLCLVTLSILRAPRSLLVAIVALACWIPVQLSVNMFVTKVSAHTAIATGCYTTLCLLGRIQSPEFRIVGLVVILLTAWARVHSRNHSIKQAVLGVMIGSAVPILVITILQ